MFGFQDDEIDENMPVKAITSIENLGRAGRRLDQGFHWLTWECNYLVELYHDFFGGEGGCQNVVTVDQNVIHSYEKGSLLTFLMNSLDGTQGVDFIPKARIDQTIRALARWCEKSAATTSMCSFFAVNISKLSWKPFTIHMLKDAEKSELIWLKSRGAFVGEWIHRYETWKKWPLRCGEIDHSCQIIATSHDRFTPKWWWLLGESP